MSDMTGEYRVFSISSNRLTSNFVPFVRPGMQSLNLLREADKHMRTKATGARLPPSDESLTIDEVIASERASERAILIVFSYKSRGKKVVVDATARRCQSRRNEFLA